MSENEFISYIELLDVDEEVIDQRLEVLIAKKSHENTHLSHAILLLRYKHVLNLKEDDECENDEEYKLVAKLLPQIREDNIDLVCKIITLTLGLNKTTLVSKSEHLLQQMLSEVIPHDISIENNRIVLIFKLCDSVFDSLLSNKMSVHLPFTELPIKEILDCQNEVLTKHFLTTTVAKFFQCVSGYNILDFVWNYVQNLQEDNKHKGLNILCCLADLYLPITAKNGIYKLQSTIFKQYEFWSIVMYGLNSIDVSNRKEAMYLAKRAIECLSELRKDVKIKSNCNTILHWDNTDNCKKSWDDFFVLVESLEEKQSNIVLPSLQLFESIKYLGHVWLNVCYNLGLKHENTQVKSKCIVMRLTEQIRDISEAETVLEAMNDINLYDNTILESSFKTALNNSETFTNILGAVAKINWSPVPLYYILNAVLTINPDHKVITPHKDLIYQAISAILKIPCNIPTIKNCVQDLLLNFLSDIKDIFHWKELVKLLTCFKRKNRISFENIVDGNEFLEFTTESLDYIPVTLSYISNRNTEELNAFLKIMNSKIVKIQNIVARQYSDRRERLDDFNYLAHLFEKTSDNDSLVKQHINTMIKAETKLFLQYISCLVVDENFLNYDDIDTCLNSCVILIQSLFTEDCLQACCLDLYKTSIIMIKEENNVAKKVFCLKLIQHMNESIAFHTKYPQEVLKFDDILNLSENIGKAFYENKDKTGRLRNKYYETNTEMVNYFTQNKTSEQNKHLKEIIQFIDNVLECGGYGCLSLVMEIIKNTLQELNDSKIQFDIKKYLDRLWKEVQVIKSSNQYSKSIAGFIDLLTHDTLTKDATYNNLILYYFGKIVELGTMTVSPLYHFTKTFSQKIINIENGQLVYILHELLLFSPVLRKDQRITEKVISEINQNDKERTQHHTKQDVQALAISMLLNIKDPEIFDSIINLTLRRIDDVFKNKVRYHADSQPHLTLLAGLQSLMFITLLKGSVFKEVVDWCLTFLAKLPHQHSVRVLLEWCVCVYFCSVKSPIDAITKTISFEKIPLTSQFLILYHSLKHKITQNKHTNEEYNYVLDFLLKHTMGSMFNVRLYAQYMTSKLYQLTNENQSKYSYTISLIQASLKENSTEKNYVKLQKDFFVNHFDVISHLTPIVIYNVLPKYFNVPCDINTVPSVNVCEVYLKGVKTDLVESWLVIEKFEGDLVKENEVEGLSCGEIDMNGVIQKKYIPWRNMTEFAIVEKKENPSDLIVVASLIDKLPNLGGMARTSEVFGVNTYVIDSLRHLQDKQFQGLSVSAERWVNIEEVRPGDPLKEYLRRKKNEGYILVAAEQTSNSVSLQKYRFPKKTLLLLGHEKEGVPCDLIPFMDHCVEIPQQGFVRSLNVHVTAAIFVWEYTRQNLL